MQRIVMFFILMLAYGCGDVYDDGTGGAGVYIDWGYVSKYRGATHESQAFSMDAKKELATALLKGIDYGNTAFNKSLSSIDTWLLLDNVSYPQNVIEKGNCTSKPQGTKEFSTQTFGWGSGYFRTIVKFNNYCMQGLNTREVAITNGQAEATEEFVSDNSSGAAGSKKVYFEMIMDNLTTNGSNLFGIVSRYSVRSKGSNQNPTIEHEGNNKDVPSEVRLGLDMQGTTNIDRFDIYEKPGGTMSKYIQYYHHTYGFVTADLAGLATDKPTQYEKITMKLADNKTCIFTREDLAKEKGQYTEWFTCEAHDLIPDWQ